MYKKMLKNEKGIALLITLCILLMLTIVGIAALTTSNTEMDIAGNQKNSLQAFYSSEAGLAQADYELKNAMEGINATGIDYDTAAALMSNPMQLLTRYVPNYSTTFPDNTFKSYQDLNNNQRYRVKYKISPDNTFIVSQQFVFSYDFEITAQGNHVDQVAGTSLRENVYKGSFSITLDRNSFAQYALFRNLTTNSSGSQLYFISGEIFGGPVHTNGKPGFSGTPIFNGPFTSHWASYSTTAKLNNANPQFNGGSQWNVPTIDLPTNSYSQERAALGGDPNDQSSLNDNQIKGFLGLSGGGAPPNGTYVPNDGTNITGGIYIYGNADSVKLNVDAYNRQVYRVKVGTQITDITVDKSTNTTTVNGTTYSGVPRGALYTHGAINSLGGTSRTSPSIASSTQLTIASSGNMYITNDIEYQGATYRDATTGQIVTDPTLANIVPEISPSATNCLGLFSSSGNILVSSNAPANLNVHATIMASGTNKGWGVQNWDTRTPVTQLKILGGIIEYQSQTVGTFSSQTGQPLTGYLRKYYFDNRYTTGFSPPYFPTRPSYVGKLASFTLRNWYQN
jgi:hypothetical protein